MGGSRAKSRIWRVPPPVHDHAAHGAASLQVRLLLALLLVFSTGQYPNCHGRNGGHGGGTAPGGETAGGGKYCMEREREALLAVRDDVWAWATDGDLKRLPSWKRDGDCCRWKGVACDHRSGHVVKLNLRYYPEYGDAPAGSSKVNPSLLNLGSLRYLDLSGNNFSGSPLPSFIGSLVNLEYLNISNTYFAGSVPLELGNLQNLKSLYLSFGFSSSSTIVENLRWLSHLSHLQYLDMSWLNLSAAHDWVQVISMLPSLSVLRLQNCELPSIVLPLGNFTSLSTLDFGISGKSTMLKVLHLSENNLSGEIPSWLGESLSTLKSLRFLDLSHNSLVGHISSSIGNLSGLVFLDLSHNSLVGHIPSSIGILTNLQILDLSHNSLVGHIPSSIGNLSRLVVLDLSHNSLVGHIPSSIRILPNLQILDLSHNSLVGHIPSSIGMLSNLELLHLDKNALTGTIPSPLKKCTRLKTLDLSENKLSGEIPSWLGQSLSSLWILSLRSNMFHGYLPISLSGLQSLQILDLANNTLSGSIILSFHNLTEMVKIEKHGLVTYVYYIESKSLVTKGNELQYTKNLPSVTMIDLSSNNFSGQFPEEITNLHGLLFLNLSNNHLSGRIPENISTMGLLESLDLSFNQLLGRVPSSMSTMTSLGVFNVSYNSLSGRIPSGQIQTFDNYSFIGNHGLCGAPILGPCPGDATSFQGPFQTGAEGFDASRDEHESYMAWFYVSLGPGFVTGFLGFLGVFSLMRRSWRIAYFRFFDSLGDTLYVFVVVRCARLKTKLSAWRGGGSSS